MFNKKTKKMIPTLVLAVSALLSVNAIADSIPDEKASTELQPLVQPLINWNEQVQATLSEKMENKLQLEMQTIPDQQPLPTQYASQSVDNQQRDLVLIGTDQSGTRVTARSTTPVVVIIDRNELCLLNL